MTIAILGRWMLTGLLTVLIALTVLQVSSRVFHSPLDFDEGYNLQIALNLRNSGQYKTFDTLLDTNITTGPTVLVPAVLLYSEQHPLYPRIIVALYFMLFLLMVLITVFRNDFERVIYLLLINITPLFFLFSTQVLGEMPGFIFLFLLYLSFDNARYATSGIMFALSVLTKSAYIIGIIPIIIVVVYDAFVLKRRYMRLKDSFYFAFSFILGVGIWEFYKFAQLGFDITDYSNHLGALANLTQAKSSALFTHISHRIDMIGYTLFVGGFFFIFFVIFIGGYSFVKSKQTTIKLLSLFTVIYTIYFIIFGSTTWYRHLFPAVLSLLLIIPQFVSSFLKGLNFERKLVIFATGIVVIVGIANFKYRDQNEVFLKRLTNQNLLFLDQSNKPYLKEKSILKDQNDMAQYIKNNTNEGDVISGFPWINSPEIAYLAGKKIYRDPGDERVTHVLFGIYNKYLDPDAGDYIKEASLQKIYGNASYELYTK